MINAELEERLAYYRQHFEEGLLRLGFRGEQDSGWVGAIERSGATTAVRISMPGNFPFSQPRVAPLEADAVPWSWHRERDGSLCLVSDDDHDDLWWREAAAFVEHATAWFVACDAGWKDDRPDLDLERYFDRADDPKLYLHGDLEGFRDGFVRFVPRANNVMLLHSRMRPPDKRRSKFKNDRFGYVVYLGDLSVPPRSWDDVAVMANAGIDLDRAIRADAIQVVVAEYERRGHRGVLVLQVGTKRDGSIDARYLTSASSAPASRAMRAGRDVALLANRSVAVVGLGAIGSFIADMLVRAGVGRLTLLDHDLVLPGNLPRHLVSSDAIGMKKVDAVKHYIVAKHGLDPDQVTARGDCLLHPVTAAELMSTHDLLINATADFAVTALLHETARAIDGRFVSVALQNEGDTVRVDVLPPPAGLEALPNSGRPAQEGSSEQYDTGCGSPISPSSPTAVIEAAAVAARHAVGLLAGRPIHPCGEIRQLTGERSC